MTLLPPSYHLCLPFPNGFRLLRLSLNDIVIVAVGAELIALLEYREVLTEDLLALLARKLLLYKRIGEMCFNVSAILTLSRSTLPPLPLYFHLPPFPSFSVVDDPSLRQHDIQDSRTSACSKVHESKPALIYMSWGMNELKRGSAEMGKI